MTSLREGIILDENEPLVSVIMSTCNPNKEYLRESIASILNQTYKNIEFIIINDASLDNLDDVITKYNDNRIRLFTNGNNLGLTKCLNIAIALSNGEFIARMDDDDISLPSRIEKQVSYFLSNENVNILGSNVEYIGGFEGFSKYEHALTREEQQLNLFFDNSGLAHPTVMFRKKFLEEHKILYKENYLRSQDYGMWVECTRYSKLYCLNNVLLKHRKHKKQISNKHRESQYNFKNKVKIDQLEKLNIIPTEDEVITHILFCENKINNLNNLRKVKKWIIKLIEANRKTNYFTHDLFIQILEKKYISMSFSLFLSMKNIIPLLYSISFLRIKYLRKPIKSLISTIIAPKIMKINK